MNKALEDASKLLDIEKEEINNLRKDLDAQLKKAEAAEKSYLNLKKVLDVRKDEIDRDELLVRKLIKTKGLASEIAKLKKDLAK